MFNELPQDDCFLRMEDIVFWELEAPQSSPALQDDAEPDFSEYMWMEHIEEFDKIEMERLEEEYRMRESIAAMMADELDEHLTELERTERENKWMAALRQLPLIELDVANSKLNPLAKEFIPDSSDDLNH